MTVSRRIFASGSSYPRSDSRYSIFFLHYSLRSLHGVPSRRLTHPQPKKRTTAGGLLESDRTIHRQHPPNKGCLTHQRPRSKILFAETIPTTSPDVQERPDQTEKVRFPIQEKSMLNRDAPRHQKSLEKQNKFVIQLFTA